MNEKLARWRPFVNNRLRLESFEERWTLGGAGFLSAPIGLLGASAIQSSTNKPSDSPTAVDAVSGKAGSSWGGRSTHSSGISTASKIGDGWITGKSESAGPVSTVETGLSNLTTPLGNQSFQAFVGTSDGFEVFNNSTTSSHNPSNIPEALTSLANPVGSVSLTENNSSTRASGGNASTPASLGASNFAGSTNSLDDAITRGSSSIAPGGFDSASQNLVGSHGGFYLFPVTKAMIDRGITDPNMPRITSLNRNAATMMGGWNPALRSIMVMDDGSRWFAAEQGTDVHVNSTMVYYRLGEDGWKAVGSVVLPAGIQQNMATVTDGRTIFSYGMTANSVIETWFHTNKPGWNLNTGNNLVAGGNVIRPGANANYVGAAWHNNTRVVWWTSVGDNGGSGRWSYTFNRIGGWNSPIVSGLGGFNDVGYVRAHFDEQSRLRLVGESYRGHYPFGEKYMASATVTLGKPAAWSTVLQQTAFTPLDSWMEGSSGSQNLYRTRTDQIGYSFDTGSNAKSMTFDALDGRFVADTDSLGLVLSYGNFLEVRVVDRTAATGFIDWNAIEPTRIGFPDSFGTAGLSAIWNVDTSKQPNESDHLEFAICGGYPAHDQLVYYYTIG